MRLWTGCLPAGFNAALVSRIRVKNRNGYATAALIFSRTFAVNQAMRRVGSGRMQEEAFECLESLDLRCCFAGQEDRDYGLEIENADIIVCTFPAVLKLPIFNHSIKLLYACNTHVDVRLERLRASSEKWNLPCEEWPNRRVMRVAYQLADYLLVAENDAGIANFVRNGVPLRKILRYRNAVDTDVWLPAAQKRDKFTFICWSSAHGLRKGLPALIAAWRQWYRGQSAELYLVGIPTLVSNKMFDGLTQGEPEPGIKLNLGVFPAQYGPVVDLIGSCHVGVYPTLEDAQPSALLEMASCGLPVITTVESSVEFPEECCRYVARDDPGELAEALEYWFQHREEVRNRGLAARDYIERKHTWPCFRSRFKEILTGLMERQM